jgi:hypothetical protein
MPSFNNKMLQGNRLGSATQPKLQYCVRLARIMVATLLLCLVVGSRGEPAFEPRPFLTIATMTTDRHGLYVADRLAKLKAISGWGGAFHDAFGGNASSKPGTSAMSRDNIAFISDDINNTIGFHRRLGATGNNPVLAAKIADSRIAADNFNIIGLAAVDGQLCVTDGMNLEGRSC